MIIDEEDVYVLSLYVEAHRITIKVLVLCNIHMSSISSISTSFRLLANVHNPIVTIYKNLLYRQYQ